MKRYFSDGKSADNVMGEASINYCRPIEVIKQNTNELVKQIADFIRTKQVVHGDQYGTWLDVSPDAETLAKAIEDEFLHA